MVVNVKVYILTWKSIIYCSGFKVTDFVAKMVLKWQAY